MSGGLQSIIDVFPIVKKASRWTYFVFFNLSLKVTPYQSCCRSCVRSGSQGVAYPEGNDFREGLKYHEVRFTVDFPVCREN